MSLLLAPFVPELLLTAANQRQFPTQWTTDGSFVFADISGFTRLSEQLAELGRAGAEELTVLLNETFESLLGVARADGGDLVKFGGDALFLFFSGDDHPERACRASLGMRAALKARGAVVTDRGRVVLRISMGVHSGPYLFALAGDAQRELFVLGEHATTVTAMEAAADAGEILVSRDTAALVPAGWLGAPKAEGVLLRRVSGVPHAPPGGHGARATAGEIQPLVPAAIRRRLDDDAHDAEHRRATVAFVHVGGIDDEVRAAGPDAVAQRLHRVVNAAVDAADRFGVTLLSTDVAGGGIKLIMTAGVPDAVEDGEGRMLGVGRALLDADLGLPVRVGVNTGYVFAGEVGAPWRRVYTVMGDAVNLAARLMAKAAPGELVASRTTLEHSATPFVTTALEPFMVKGKRQPQHASVVGQRIEGRRHDTLAGATFVGRTEELSQLAAAAHAAVNDVGACVEVVGEPGIGKSRLVRELAAQIGDVRTVRLTCEPFAVDRPYFMARVLLRAALGIAADASAEDAGAALVEWLDRHLPDSLPLAPLLAVPIDAAVASNRVVDDLRPEYRVGALREAASAVLHAAFAHPLLLIVEDAMWMDEASSLVIAAALRRVEEAPWFGCFTTRDPAQGLSSRLGYEAATVALSPLDEAVAADLAAELTDDAAIPQSEVVELCARAKGNPLFLLELAHARRELGSLDAIPGSLEDLIAARIDRLSPADRNLLRLAAVLGDRFSPQLFDRTLGDAFPTPPAWSRLADFVIVDQGEFRFTHDLVRRVAYAGLPFRRRRELHLRIGHALVPRHGEPDGARLGLLALHFDGSGDRPLAWKYNRLAGRRAADSYATVEATGFYERAIDNARAAGDVPTSELAEAHEALADAALLAGRYDLVGAGLRGARRLVAGDALATARLCRKEGKLREQLGRHGAAIRWFRKGLATLDSTDETRDSDVAAELGRLEVAVASTLIWQQKYRQCAAWCRRALPHSMSARDRSTEAHAYYLLDWALGELGDPEGAVYRELAGPIYEELGDYHGLAAVLNNRGVDELGAGKWTDASASLLAARAAYQRSGDLVTMAQTQHNLAEVYIEQGRHEEAEVYLRESRRIWRSSGFAMGVAAVTNGLGRALARSGRADDGVLLLRDALERFEALGHTPFVAETAARLGEALVFGGRDGEAIDVLDHFDGVLPEGGPAVECLARRIRGTALARLGDTGGASSVLASTRDLADETGIEWESALAAIELARLPGTSPDEREYLERPAVALLERMGVRVANVLPPLEPPVP